jgi:SAM-dependent methyltransferase
MDVGAGTGLLTRVLVTIAADMSPPGHVTAVEPDPGMATVLGQRLPSVRVIPAPAEHIDASDETLDCIVVGQAFHWFDREAAVAEFARLLRRGGRLGVMWNVRLDSEPWVSALADIVDGEDHTRSKGTLRDADSMSVGFDPHGLFDKVERAEFAHSLSLDAEHLVGLVDTFSYVRLSPHRDSLLEQVRELTQTHPDLVGKESFELPYLTITYRATRP